MIARSAIGPASLPILTRSSPRIARAAAAAGARPGLLPDHAGAYFGAWEDEAGITRLPLAITLPAMALVSLGLWAGIFTVASILL